MELIPSLPDDISHECLIRIPYNKFSMVATVCRRWKEEVNSSEFHRKRKARGLNRDILVMIQASPIPPSGGMKYPSCPTYKLTLYDPVTAVWSKLPPVPGFSKGLPLFCQCAGVGQNLVVIGGWNPATWEVSNAVFVYNLVSATWRRGADMPGELRSFFTCMSDSNRMVFVAGGHDVDKIALRSAIAYDVLEDKWIPLPDMSRERDECKGIFHHGKFQVIGGYCTETQGRFERSAESFDVTTWQWDEVLEDVLDIGTCPRTCITSDEKMYRCRAGYVVVLEEGSTWQTIVKLPYEVHVSPYLLTWQGNLLVIGTAKYGGPYLAYMLDLKYYTWTKVIAPEEYSGLVQAGCCLEI